MRVNTVVIPGLLAVACLAACGGEDLTEPDGASCAVGQVLSPGEKCSAGGGDTFEVMPDAGDGIGSLACLIESDGVSRTCSNNEVTKGMFSASNIEDTLDWRVDSMPS